MSTASWSAGCAACGGCDASAARPIMAARGDPTDQLLERVAPAVGVGADDQNGLAARDQVAGHAGEALAAAVAHCAESGKRGAEGGERICKGRLELLPGSSVEIMLTSTEGSLR